MTTFEEFYAKACWQASSDFDCAMKQVARLVGKP